MLSIIPKISIIVPCYNVEKYLERCLLSLVNQTLKEIEIILVDDGSPDNCPALCDEWAKKDSRIKVIHKTNGGLGYARNSGLDIAKGEYIAFVDSDDYVDTRMYELLYNAAEKEKHDAVFCGLRQETTQQSYNFIRDYDRPVLFTASQMPRLALSFLHKTELNTQTRLFMSVWHGIYKRELIEKLHLRFYSEREVLSEDLPFQIEFFKNAKSAKFIPDYLYTYCLNTNGLSHYFKLNKFKGAKNLRFLLYKLIPNNKENIYFIDIEYYGRIRNLLTYLIFAHNLTWKEKYKFTTYLCKSEDWNTLQVYNSNQTHSWKYMNQYRLLKANRPIFLILFIIIDKYINKVFLKNLFKIFISSPFKTK